jgi:integrase
MTESISFVNQGLADPANRRLVRRLGPHHFAYLRAIAEGLDANDSALRYLGTTHGHERRSAHKQLVDTVQAIARRSGESAWRLVGVTIQSKAPGTERPTLQAFIDDQGLDGWSEVDQLEMLEAAFPTDRRAARRDRLRQRQMDMLRRLERSDAQHPRSTDLVSEWFDESTARRLLWAGHTTLQELATRVAAGGKWYRSMPGIGITKAQRIATHLLTLIPAALPPEKPFFALKQIHEPVHVAPVLQTNEQTADPTRSLALPSSGQLSAPYPIGTLLDAKTDAEAVNAWIRARCSTQATVKSYTRESRRLMLWLIRERRGKRFADMSVEDCMAYQTFLQHVPPSWISRNRVTPGFVGWAPFRGPLTPASQQLAIKIVSGLFAWLTASKYLAGNPWILVNSDTGSSDQITRLLETKSISEGAMTFIHEFLADQPPSPSVQRMQFILTFMESVGLRSAELLSAKLGAFSLQPEGWTLRVTGKGSKTRTVFIPRPAFDALQSYLSHRGLGGIESAPTEAPLLASVLDGMSPVSYQALYLTVKVWLSKAISASPLASRERIEMAGATTHWLRHTFGTRAVAKEVPYDVIQQQMGHASVSTTMNIYARAPLRRRASELSRAFR